MLEGPTWEGMERTFIHAARISANVESGMGCEKSTPEIEAPKVGWRELIVRVLDDGLDILV
jgi:hypothetical protein